MSPGPLSWPENWLTLVNTPHTEAELTALRRCVNRGQPFGPDPWTQRTARRLSLTTTLQPRGRPKNQAGTDKRS